MVGGRRRYIGQVTDHILQVPAFNQKFAPRLVSVRIAVELGIGPRVNPPVARRVALNRDPLSPPKNVLLFTA